jgi:hypothetical protein
VVAHLPVPIAALLAIAAGAGAFGVHAVKAKARIGSTVMTLGHVNPLLSVAEDGVASTLSVAAVVVPAIACAFLLLMLWLLLRKRLARAPR